MAIVNYNGVELRQDNRPVLTDISLSVGEGELVYILGEVGSGKSTLLKSVYGEVPVAAGQASVLDTDMRRMRPRRLPKLRRRLGIIFQDFQLLRDRTVDENLTFVLRATGWKKKAERRGRIDQVLAQVGMEGSQGNMPHELSGGEQQCVCIARALLNNPKLLIADEPTANLDRDSATRVMTLLNSIRESGTAIMLSTHNESMAAQFPGRTLRCKDGHLTEETQAKTEETRTEETSTTDNTEEA